MAGRIFLSLGSNLGARRENLKQALDQLDNEAASICRCSSVYRTEPVDFLDQPDFLNLSCEIRTDYSPAALLHHCLATELAMGRIRNQEKGPRIIDIDLLFYGDTILQSEDLIVPHPHLRGRRFVLVPLAEIAPEFRDPITGKTISNLLRDCPDLSQVRRAGSPISREGMHSGSWER